MADLGDRSTYIGASDVPIIMGSLYLPATKKTRWHLWAQKVGHPDYVPAAGSPEAEVGKLAEPFLIAWAEQHLGMPIDRRGTTRRLEGTPILVHLDAVLRGQPPAPIECKTSGLLGGRSLGWTADTIPTSVYHQVQTQIAAAEADQAYVVALVGHLGLRMYEVARDQPVIDRILAQCEQFWKHVETQTPPEEQPYDPDIAVRVDRSGSIELPTEVLPILRDYATASRNAREAEAMREDARQRLLAIMGSAEAGTVEGWHVRVKRVTQRRVDAKALENQFPDVYEKCLTSIAYLRLDVRPPQSQEETCQN